MQKLYNYLLKTSPEYTWAGVYMGVACHSKNNSSTGWIEKYGQHLGFFFFFFYYKGY